MIQCQDTAFREFYNELLKRGKHPRNLNEFNNGRHRLIQVEGKKYYLIYKREFFNTFEKQFEGIYKASPYLAGVGESINKESLEIALYNRVESIIFIHPFKFYSIYPMLIKTFCEKNNLVRMQDKSNRYKGLNGTKRIIREMTYSFPKKLLTEF